MEFKRIPFIAVQRKFNLTDRQMYYIRDRIRKYHKEDEWFIFEYNAIGEKELDEKEADIEKSVSNKVGYIRDKLDKEYRFKHNSLYTFFVGTTLYSFLITIFQAFKSKYFISDFKYALATFKSWIIFVYDFLLKQKPIDSDTGKWIGFVFMVIVVIGLSMVLIGTFGWLAHKLYTEYAYNWLSVAIALISLSGAVFFADELHSCDFNWVFGFLVIQILYLFMVIMDAGVNNK